MENIILYYGFFFVVGLFVGSFLNVVSDRLINGGSILFGRSHCDSCKKDLSVKNLVPVLSFLFQKGKCSFCKIKLSWYYPVSEVLTGVMFALSAYLSGFIINPTPRSLWDLIFLVTIFSLFIVLFLTDAKYQLIPDVISYWAIGLTVFFMLSGYVFNVIYIYNKLNADVFGQYLLKAGYIDMVIKNNLQGFGLTLGSALAIAFFFLFLVWITKERGMGQGDIKLGLLIGLFNGFPQNVIAIFLGFFLGAFYSVVMILLKQKTMKDTVPFGPFLILGSVMAMLYGNSILNWYVHLF